MKPSMSYDQAVHELQTMSERRLNAIWDLGAIGDSRAVPVILDVMLNGDAEFCRNCVAILMNFDDRRAVPMILKALDKYQEIQVSEECIAVLDYFKDYTATPTVLRRLPQHKQDENHTLAALYYLIHAADPAMKGAMLDLVGDTKNSQRVRVLALEALETLHDPSIGAQIIPLINEKENPVVAGRAALLAGRVGIREAIANLVQLLPVPMPYRQLPALQGLAGLQDPAAVEPLAQFLSVDDPELRLAAVDGLAAFRQPELATYLISSLGDGDAVVRAHAATGLGNCGSASAVPALLKALKDEHAAVRTAAAEALGKYRGARKELTARLADASAEVRATVVQALGATGDPTCAPALAARLADADAGVRAAAATALARLGEGAVPAILPLLKAGKPVVRARAAETLGRLKATPAIPALTARLADPSPLVRLWALSALGEMPQPPQKAIKQGFKDADPAVRTEAARVVDRRHLTALARALLPLLTTGTRPERAAAYAALCTLAGKDLGPTPSAWEAWVKETGK